MLTLDYTAPGAPAADEVVAPSRAEKFVPAVSVLGLDRPPHAPAARRASMIGASTSSRRMSSHFSPDQPLKLPSTAAGKLEASGRQLS